MQQNRQPEQRNRTEQRGRNTENSSWRDFGNDKEPRREPRRQFDDREPREFDERTDDSEYTEDSKDTNLTFLDKLNKMILNYMLHLITTERDRRIRSGTQTFVFDSDKPKSGNTSDKDNSMLEFELRFTGNSDPLGNQIPITKEDYENVLQVFKSSAYSNVEPGNSTSSSVPTGLSYNGDGEYLLRIYPFYNGKPSKYRCEITGIADIQKYCETNDWRQCESARFVEKKRVSIMYINHIRDPSNQSYLDKYFEVEKENSVLDDIKSDLYELKASCKTEHVYVKNKEQNGHLYSLVPELRSIADNWSKVEKTYRYMNRVSFSCGEMNKTRFPYGIQGFIKMDASIVKSSNQAENGRFIPVRDIHQSGVFSNFEKYELELEFDNSKISQLLYPLINVGPGGIYNSYLNDYLDIFSKELNKSLRKVLIGLQKTDYPISKAEKIHVLEDYIGMLHKLYTVENRNINLDSQALIDFHETKGGLDSPKNFIGPSSVALQFEHLYKDSASKGSQTPYVPLNFAVTDKADGERCLLFLSPSNFKLYLIDMNMNIRYTGLTYDPPAVTDDGVHHRRVDSDVSFIIDGEYITKDKNGNSINLFMAFDIYFKSMEDCREKAFIMSESTPYHVSRYKLLQDTVFDLNSALGRITLKNKNKSVTRDNMVFKTNLPSHDLRIAVKNFEYSYNGAPEDFYAMCNRVLSVNREYNTDGLIFTPVNLAVGASPKDPILPSLLQKMRWDQSLKWKPPQYNTNDFLVTTVKTSSNKDKVSSLIVPNTNLAATSQIPQYKTLELRCGFSYKNSGFLDAATKILNPSSLNKLREELFDRKLYMPVLFHPTEYPDKYAHICNVILTPDENGVLQMTTEEGDVIEDNTIVEFRYEKTNGDGFRWIPLRVRSDKTQDYRRGLRSYGNDYETANGNWKTIHQPITEEMLKTGNLPSYDEVVSNKEAYYNKGNSGDRDVLQKFHNYVKEQLILSQVQSSQTIIDLACGKAGDMWKWDKARASFVLGVDYSIDNIENRFDGAAARYINYYKDHPNGLVCVFAAGDSSKNIRRGYAQPNEKYKMITNAILGIGGQQNEEILTRYFGKGAAGFDVCSCQFALHYFFRNKETLEGFMTNVCENTKLGGVFIGTCYDGKKVFQAFNQANTNELVIYSSEEEEKYKPDPNNPHTRSYFYKQHRYDHLTESEDEPKQNTVYWKCVRKYNQDYMEDDSSSLGYSIDVYQKSIGSIHVEYLVNFDYLVRVMRQYGFEPVEIKPFDNYYDELSKSRLFDKFRHLENIDEKYITSLNNSFVFKKVSDVDASLISLDDAPIRQKEEEMEKREEMEEVEQMKTINVDEIKIQPKEESLPQITSNTATPLVKMASIIPHTATNTTMEETYGKPQEGEPIIGFEEIKAEPSAKAEPVFTEVQKSFEKRTRKSPSKPTEIPVEKTQRAKKTKVKIITPPVSDDNEATVNVAETFNMLTTRPFNAIDEKQTMGSITLAEVEEMKTQTPEIPVDFEVNTETDTPIITFKTRKPSTKKTKIIIPADEDEEEKKEEYVPQVVEEVPVPVQVPEPVKAMEPPAAKSKPVICKENQEIVNGKCYKKCDEDQIRNPETGRCKKAESKTKAPKKSKIIIDDEDIEVPKASPEEKKVSPETSPESPEVKIKSITKTRKNPCKEDKEVNPDSGRCRKKCEEGETRSASTGKCLKTRKNK